MFFSLQFSKICGRIERKQQQQQSKTEYECGVYCFDVYIVENDCRALRTRSDEKLRKKNDNVSIVATLTSALRLFHSTSVAE